MFRLKELLNGIRVLDCHGRCDLVNISGVVSDSRMAYKDAAYVCLKGGKNDGHDFVCDAVKNGATVVVYSDKSIAKVKNVTYVLVQDTRSANAMLWANMYKKELKSLKIIAVTGTNGKTTVTKMIEHTLNLTRNRCAVIGTLGAAFGECREDISSMTTPDPERLYPLLAEYARCGAEYVVMEASSHALALKKLDGLTFEVAAITNMTAEHLDFHGNMHMYYNAKAELFTKAKKGVFLCDDYYTVKMYNESKCQKISCSVRDRKCNYYAENAGYSFENGTIFTVVNGEESFPVHCIVPAEFTVSNALLASAVLSELSIEKAEIYKGIASLEGVCGRLEKIYNGEFSVYIDFAHTPDALAKLIESVRRLKKREQRIVTLFGCGGDRDRSKRALMGTVASHLSDFVIITSDNSRSESKWAIIDEIMVGFDKSCPHVRIEDRAKAIEYAIENAESEDIILLCGKGHEAYEIDGLGVHSFSEREIVKQAIDKRKRMEEDK